MQIDLAEAATAWTHLARTVFVPQARINATWRTEALYFLLWAVKVVPELPFPIEESRPRDFIERMPQPEDSPWPFIGSVELRPLPEILDASDLIYRLRWATREYGEEANANGGVVQEWHHAVNWLTNYDGGEDWDSVGTDT